MYYMCISNVPCTASQPKWHSLAMVPTFKTARSDPVPCSFRAAATSLPVQPVQTDPCSADIWSWCPASHQSLRDPAWPSNTHGRALLPHTMLIIEIWCFEAITSTLYLLSTGRIPSGTGRMGPRSMSVGPSIGGRSDLPPGPIWKRCSMD